MKKKAEAGKLGLRRHLVVLDNRHLDDNDKALYLGVILKTATRVLCLLNLTTVSVRSKSWACATELPSVQMRSSAHWLCIRL